MFECVEVPLRWIIAIREKRKALRRRRKVLKSWVACEAINAPCAVVKVFLEAPRISAKSQAGGVERRKAAHDAYDYYVNT